MAVVDYLERILLARVYDVALESPLELAPLLTERLGRPLLLKREDLQPVFSFKLRGAYNKLAHLPREVLERGVICASAGNHAQGVALSAQRMGIRAVVVMPVMTPSIKVAAVRSRGAEVVLHGASFDDAQAHAETLMQTHGLTFVHPFDDPDVIAGQGTIGMEILRQHPGELTAVFCAVGGGGLIAGVGTYIKRLRPEVRVIGVEAVDADAMSRSLRAGQRVRLQQVGLFADGAAVKQVGEETFRLAQLCVDEIVTVDNDAICAAIKDVFGDTRSILEPAGALAVAGAKAWAARESSPSGTLVAVTSGANMNFDRLRFVAERAEIGEHREALLAVTIPEQPGSFRRFCEQLGRRSVTEFNYRYAEGPLAHVFVGLEVGSQAERRQLISELQRHKLPTVDLTEDEFAKLHLRNLVGGRSAGLQDERLLRFTFPERPGALLDFLSAMHSSWNISLFHYRNHGADFGRVLIGIQVPTADSSQFAEFLGRVGYEWVEETANRAYHLFLG
jgi:threonine dehydratase